MLQKSHDNLRDLKISELELLLENEGEEKVERTLESIEVQVEISNRGRAQSERRS